MKKLLRAVEKILRRPMYVSDAYDANQEALALITDFKKENKPRRIKCRKKKNQ